MRLAPVCLVSSSIFHQNQRILLSLSYSIHIFFCSVTVSFCADEFFIEFHLLRENERDRNYNEKKEMDEIKNRRKQKYSFDCILYISNVNTIQFRRFDDLGHHFQEWNGV